MEFWPVNSHCGNTSPGRDLPGLYGLGREEILHRPLSVKEYRIDMISQPTTAMQCIHVKYEGCFKAYNDLHSKRINCGVIYMYRPMYDYVRPIYVRLCRTL